MKIINAGYEIIEEKSIVKKIERIARVCYKSEHLIAEDSGIKMIRKLIKNKHTAMLEHASLAFIIDVVTYNYLFEAVNFGKTVLCKDRESKRNYLRFSTYGKESEIQNDKDNATHYYEPLRYIVSGNIRAWLETLEILKEHDFMPKVLVDALVDNSEGIFDYIKGNESVASCYDTYLKTEHFVNIVSDFGTLSEEERMLHEDFSVLFTTDRGVTHELVRMRECSFAQESTRYCCYANDKFGNELTVIKPCFWEDGSTQMKLWEEGCKKSEEYYFALLEEKATPQQARSILSHSVKADLVMTTNLREWHHVFSLRACDSTGPAHPQVKEIMCPLLKEMQQGKYDFAFGDLTLLPE